MAGVGGGAFRVLLLVVTAASAQTVPPPANVMVRCQDLQTTVEWEYDQLTPQTKFLVTVNNKSTQPHVTSEHRYTVNSSSFWGSMADLMDVHYFTVTAARGDERSEGVSRTFSFNNVKEVDAKCTLPLPPLALRHLGTQLTFRNPVHHYTPLWTAAETDPDATFKFFVAENNDKLHEETCRSDFCRWDFAEAVEACVNVTGALVDGTEVGTLQFIEQRVCSTDSPEDDPMVLGFVLVSVLGLVVVVAAVVIYKVKAYQLYEPLLKEPPASLRVEKATLGGFAAGSDGVISCVRVVVEEEEDSRTLIQELEDEGTQQQKVELPLQEVGGPQQEAEPRQQGVEQQEEEDGQDEEPLGNYEPRHIVVPEGRQEVERRRQEVEQRDEEEPRHIMEEQQDLGDGEMVTVYGCR